MTRTLDWQRLGCVAAVFVSVALLSSITGCKASKDQNNHTSSDHNENVRDPYEDWKVEDQPWEKVRIKFPEKNSSIVFWRRHAHSFMAEYDRKVVLYKAEKKSREFDLPPNTGGRTRIDVYVLNGTDDFEIWLHDKNDDGSAYVLSLGNIPFRIEGRGKYWKKSCSVYRRGPELKIPKKVKLIGQINSSGKSHRLRFVVTPHS